MKRRRLLFALIIAAPVAAVAVACSFPDVEFSDSPDGGGTTSPDGVSPTTEGSTSAETSTKDGTSPVTDSSTDSSDTDSSNSDAGPPIFDGAIADADTTDAAQVDAQGCAAQPTCDCDNDGYRAADCGVDVSLTDASLKPGDCDDLNAARHPEAGPHTDVTDNGDWNCDGVVTKSPPSGLTSCPVAISPLGTASCPASTGYATDPGCGRGGEIFTCATQLYFGKCATPVDAGTVVVEQCQ